MKHKEPGNLLLSVSLTQRAQKSPTKCSTELKPWIDLANWMPKLLHGITPELIRQIEQEKEPSFPKVQLRKIIDLSSTQGISDQFFLLVRNIYSIFHAAIKSYRGNVPGCFPTDYEMTVDNGTVQFKIIQSPFAQFIKVFENTETERIRRCPVCDIIYFAARITKPACSETCGRTYRIRRFRQNHKRKYL